MYCTNRRRTTVRYGINSNCNGCPVYNQITLYYSRYTRIYTDIALPLTNHLKGKCDVKLAASWKTDLRYSIQEVYQLF